MYSNACWHIRQRVMQPKNMVHVQREYISTKNYVQFSRFLILTRPWLMWRYPHMREDYKSNLNNHISQSKTCLSESFSYFSHYTQTNNRKICHWPIVVAFLSTWLFCMQPQIFIQLSCFHALWHTALSSHLFHAI